MGVVVTAGERKALKPELEQFGGADEQQAEQKKEKKNEARAVLSLMLVMTGSNHVICRSPASAPIS